VCIYDIIYCISYALRNKLYSVSIEQMHEYMSKAAKVVNVPNKAAKKGIGRLVPMQQKDIAAKLAILDFLRLCRKNAWGIEELKRIEFENR